MAGSKRAKKYRKEKAFITEKELEDECCHIAFYDYGFLNLKQLSDKGVPDRMFFRNGCAFFVEFKDLGKKPTKLQSHFHKQLESVGMNVYVIDSIEDFKEVMDIENIQT